MKIASPVRSLAAAFLLSALPLEAATPTADLFFSSASEKLPPPEEPRRALPPWLVSVSQTGGIFQDQPGSWRVEAAAPEGTGRLVISLDRAELAGDLVVTLLHDVASDADLAVQLLDRNGSAVGLDLFGNLLETGPRAFTDTFIVPLRKNPNASQIEIKRLRGEVTIYGAVLLPVTGQDEETAGKLDEFAHLLGDSLNPENPLVRGVQQIAKNTSAPVQFPTSESTSAAPLRFDPLDPPPRRHPGFDSRWRAALKPIFAPGVTYPAAVLRSKNAPAPQLPTAGLVGHWSLENGNAADASGLALDSIVFGKPETVAGIRGQALRLNGESDWVKIAHADAIDLKDTLTVAAWVKYAGVAPNWGSQIIWYGDTNFGCDPYELHILPNGQLQFRGDRDVTGKPKFTVFENELRILPGGKSLQTQHVGIESPKPLAPDRWYFVAGTVEKIAPAGCLMKLFVNGTQVGEVATPEAMSYDTSKMWLGIGAVDNGNWQNYAGTVDEVRVFDRALSPAEIAALYAEPTE